ncbi:MAG: sigma-70 family RNA polymerase sigma factor [Candidatus ainarchaeum sp.]|nr:sigma-70 family RNA polymerase sigma factor [Candidatus ainarchaeum sp.]
MPGNAKPRAKPIIAQKQRRPPLKKLFNQYNGLVLRIARTHFLNPADQQDALQEVFLRLQRNRAKLDPGRNIPSLIGTIAQNVCHDMLRSKRIRPANQLPEAFFQYLGIDLRRGSRKESSEAQLLRKENLELAKKAMQKLSIKDQGILALAQAQLPYKEIASLLGIPEGTVKSRIGSARQHLLKILGEDFFEE